MSFQTVEVELNEGHVRPRHAESLPPHAHALLTILGPAAPVEQASPALLGELVGDLAGIGRGEHTDLSTNKAHLDDFGR
jgi:hypothetical protein